MLLLPDVLYFKFFRPVSCFERLLTFFSLGRFCHCGVTFLTDKGAVYVESIAPRGVVIHANAGPTADQVCELRTSKDGCVVVLAWFIAHQDEKYGWLDLLRIGVRKWTGLSVFGNPKGMVCSECLASMLDALGLWSLHNTELTPSELADFLSG